MTDTKPRYHVASFSGGKDSTAMVLRLIELGEPLDEVVFCDTTVEFPAMYGHIEKVKQVVESAGIKFTTLKGRNSFMHLFFEYKPNKKDPALARYSGKSWPSPLVRWCTRDLKVDVIERFLNRLSERRNVIQYVGIAADEQHRLNRKQQQTKNKRFPLVDWGWDEETALQYCVDRGYDWEGLYDIFDRVSCWCCPFKTLPELRKLNQHFPDLWVRLREMDEQTWRQFRADYSVADLDRRFALEDALIAEGQSIKNKQFFADLKRLLADEATIEEIINERKEENHEHYHI